MKYLKTCLVFLIFVLFAPSYVFAAACYGTRMPEKHHFAFGLEGYGIAESSLEGNGGELSSRQYFLRVSFGVFDWLAIDLKGGAGDIHQHLTTSEDLVYPTRFAGGYGLRVKFLDMKDVKMVFGFQHISVHPYHMHLGGVKNKAVLDDWQVSLLGSYDMKLATPYLGVRWARVDYIHWVNHDRKRLMSDLDNAIGLIAGVDIPFGEKTWINIEGQFIDRVGLSVSLNWDF